jgi:hypothetical protein
MIGAPELAARIATTEAILKEVKTRLLDTQRRQRGLGQ